MGSAIIISFLLNNPGVKVAGIIASAPPLGMKEYLDPVKKGFVHYLLPEFKDFALTASINTMAISWKYEVMKYFITNWLIMPIVGAP